MNHPSQKIRNFTVIAHIDHGKSTLADRMLELTKTVESRHMREQVLDQMDLERERGITIKMQPVRMQYVHGKEEYTFNLIDTPGHIDFAYEVSRALKAVEGAILLVDATQGVQAQTLTVFSLAQEMGLSIIPVLSKIDAPHARVEEVRDEVVKLVECNPDDVLLVSGKTGEGVPALLEAVVARIPAPEVDEAHAQDGRGLVFDFEYDTHKGIIVYVRVWDGAIKKGDTLSFVQAGESFNALATGIFTPRGVPKDKLHAGEIGYIETGIKKAGIASVGDTVRIRGSKLPALAGYREPRPVVWASLYPESQDDFTFLRSALERLHAGDPSLSFEEETSGALGRGFRCGFLGMLHLEIITERLKREHKLSLIIASPSITYMVHYKNGASEMIYTPSQFPDHGNYERVEEPWVKLNIIVPERYVGEVMTLLYEHEGTATSSETFGGERIALEIEMPLRELMRNFFDALKSATSGFASLSYEFIDPRPADVTRLDVLVAEEPVLAFSRVVAQRRVQEEAKDLVEKLYNVLPKQLFVVKIQGRTNGRILASKTLAAMRKDVTAKLYGGDVTRKRKLLEKQKKGKKRMGAQGKVQIPQDVFLSMMK